MYQIHRGGALAATPAHTASASLPDEAHCERVAALTRELAGRLDLKPDLRFVESVALLHHQMPRNVAEPSGLLSDSLRAVHGMLPRGRNADAFLHGEIVRLANAFDEMIEWLEFEPQSINHVITELETIAPIEGWRPALMRALHEISQDRLADLLAAGQKLPVSAVAAVRKLACTRTENLTVDSLYKVAAGDPVLATDVLRVVNSAAHHTLRGTVDSLQAGIVYLGAEKTRTVLLSALARGVLASSGIRNVWQHSLKVATYAKQLAEHCNCDPDSAMLAGLLHDVGRLAAEKLDSETLHTRARMKERSAPAVWIDLVTCRHDHAEVGSRLMAGWGFSAETVECVLHHHSPEQSDSKLASVLYLAEQQNPDHEDLPSLSRMQHALKTLALSEWPVVGLSGDSYLSALTA